MLALAALLPFSEDDGKKKHYKKFALDKSKVAFTVVLFSSLVQSILFCNFAFLCQRPKIIIFRRSLRYVTFESLFQSNWCIARCKIYTVNLKTQWILELFKML